MKTHLGIVALLLTLAPLTATAKSKKMLPYSYQTVWSTAIRLIRVDRSYRVTDKDKENGYVLFVFPGRGSVKDCPASLEIFKARDHTGRDMINLQLNIAHQPSYVELNFLEALERKLRRERGTPRPPKRAPKQPAP